MHREQSQQGSTSKRESQSAADSGSAPLRYDEPTIITHRQATPPAGAGSLDDLASSPPHALAAALIGTRLAHFEIREFVGGGGMGTVFRAQDTQLDRTVAVKILSRDQGDDEETVRRFRNEAQSAARLDHENIARVYYFGEDRGLHYIVFEFIEGTNVRDLVAESGPLSVELALSYTLQVADALEHASSRSVVHRDIKPSNVIVTGAGRAKLVDMGLARLHQIHPSADDLTASGVTLGTFDYISPEQARDPRNADVRSDIYSLGCTLFFMLTGRPPFPDGTVLQKLLQHQGDVPPDPREFNPAVPDALWTVMRKMLSKDPAKRYQTPAQLNADLLPIGAAFGLQRAGGGDYPWNTTAPAAGPTWERFAGIAVAAALLLVAVAISPLVTLDSVAVGSGQRRVLGDPPRSQAAAPSTTPGGTPQRNGTVTVDDTSARAAPSVPVDALPDARRAPATNDGDRQSNGDVDSRAPPSDGPTSFDESNGRASGSSTTGELQRESVADVPSNTSPEGNGADTGSGASSLAETAVDDQDVGPDGSGTTGEDVAPVDFEGTSSTNSALASPSAAEANVGAALEAVRPTNPPAEGVLVVTPDPNGSGEYATLADACEAAEEGDVIELRYNGPLATRAIQLENPGLTIRGAAGFAPVVTWQSARQESSGERPESFIDIDGGRLTLVHVEIELPSGRPARAMVRMRDVEAVRLQACVLTLAETETVFGPGDGAAFFEIAPASSSDTEASDDFKGNLLELEDCLVRGAATLLSAPQAVAAHLLWHNGLLLTSDRLLSFGGCDAPPKDMDQLVVELDHLTAVMRRGMCLFENNWEAPFQIPAEIRCTNSILIADSDAALIEQRGVDRIHDMRGRLEWHGDRNFYEGVDVFWQIHGLDQDQAPDQMTLPTWRSFWGGTRENLPSQSRVAWRGALPTDRPLAEQTAADYLLDDDSQQANPARGAASDGFDAGFRADLLAQPYAARTSGD